MPLPAGSRGSERLRPPPAASRVVLVLRMKGLAALRAAPVHPSRLPAFLLPLCFLLLHALPLLLCLVELLSLLSMLKPLKLL